jgi:hypothetical protein
MKKSVIMMLALTALFGCSKMEQEISVDATGNPVDGVPVKLTGMVEGTVDTRGAGALNSIPTGGLALNIFRVNSNDGGTYGTAYNAQLSANLAQTGGAITITPTQKFNPNPAVKSSFIALYPQTSVASWTYTPASRTITGTLDGSTDVLSSNVVQGDKNNPEIALPLAHLLTKIEVKVQAKNGDDLATVRTVWGKVKKIEVAGLPNTITLTLPTPVAGGVNSPATLTASGSVAFELKNATGAAAPALTIPAYNSPATFGYAMFLPVAATGITLNVYTESKAGSTPAYTAVAAAQAFVKGTGYVITLTFSISGAGGIDVDIDSGTTLGVWASGGTIGKDL